MKQAEKELDPGRAAAKKARFLDVQDELARAGRLTPPLSPVAGSREVFLDKGGKVGKIRTVRREEVMRGRRLDRPAVRRLVDDIVTDLARRVNVEGTARQVTLFVDLGTLGRGRKAYLKREIKQRLRAAGLGNQLHRLEFL